MEGERLEALRASLLDWFDRYRRDLPWRVSDGTRPDPYRVWLSEVMLQQTRVDTVRPYYERWLERFPTLEHLAEAPLDDVLKAWEGLGYYSRARNLHRAVREVAERYGGEVPSEPELFQALPGVGPYTAGAVMSIAYERPEPVVDGNVRRVFARLLDLPDPAPAELWDLAGRLVKGNRPGDLNQALMELGALVCTPRSPSCERCPVPTHCAARLAGTQAERPAKRKRPPVPTEFHGVAIVTRGGRRLLVRRKNTGRLGGLWEFPGGCTEAAETVEQAAARAVRESAGIEVRDPVPIGAVTHLFSHVRVVYSVFRTALAPGAALPSPDTDAVRWMTAEEIEHAPLPRAQRRIVRLLADQPASTTRTKKVLR